MTFCILCNGHADSLGVKKQVSIPVVKGLNYRDICLSSSSRNYYSNCACLYRQSRRNRFKVTGRCKYNCFQRRLERLDWKNKGSFFIFRNLSRKKFQFSDFQEVYRLTLKRPCSVSCDKGFKIKERFCEGKGDGKFLCDSQNDQGNEELLEYEFQETVFE